MQTVAGASAIHSRPLLIRRQLLAYNNRLETRHLDQVDLLVVHCTELPDLKLAREFAERVVHEKSATGNAGHFYIDLDGEIYHWVELERVAHHVRGMNQRSVGVELVNIGRYPDWYRSDRQTLTEPYPPAQVDALMRLTNTLEKLLPQLAWIAGHEELDVAKIPAQDDATQMIQRKVDPGTLFPWPQVSAATGLSRWQVQSEDGI